MKNDSIVFHVFLLTTLRQVVICDHCHKYGDHQKHDVILLQDMDDGIKREMEFSIQQLKTEIGDAETLLSDDAACVLAVRATVLCACVLLFAAFVLVVVVVVANLCGLCVYIIFHEIWCDFIPFITTMTHLFVF